jgi:hypothetical protein
MTADIEMVRRVLQASRRKLHTHANIVATGVGYKVTGGKRTTTPAIVCSVTRKLGLADLSPRDVVPRSIDGLATDVVETGVIRALQSRTGRVRPAPGGVSIGHRAITAGTLGCLVRRDGETVILSNNHVLANSNNAQPGDAILQPGPYDGGKFPDDHIANLVDFVPIAFSGSDAPSSCPIGSGVAAALNGIAALLGSSTRLRPIAVQAGENTVDAAIARPLSGADVSDEILEIGRVRGLGTGSLGLAVKKSGRTTGLTTGQILQVDVTAAVSYGEGKTAQFADQLMAGPMSQGGDSGSAVLDDNDRLIGLLFAGSDASTIINRIENVFSSLRLTL